MTTPAGWYPDPAGMPMQRYFDGSEWTEHYAPAQQYAPAPPSTPVAGVVTVGGENHLLYAVLTLLTCGLFLPLWLIVAATERKRPVAIDMYGNVIRAPRAPGEPEPTAPGPPAWLDKFPWLHKLPGDPMAWVIFGGLFGTIGLMMIVLAVVGLILKATGAAT